MMVGEMGDSTAGHWDVRMVDSSVATKAEQWDALTVGNWAQ